MKKKAIEKIPYMGLQKVKRGKAVEYVAVTGIYEIGRESHLFIEVYRNQRECMAEPKVRIVLAKNDFGTFFPESGVWSAEKVNRWGWRSWKNDALIWQKDDSVVRSEDAADNERNVMQSEQDLKRLREFTHNTIFAENRWWNYIEMRQEEINCRRNRERNEKKYERRKKALKDRIENTPELPEEEILEYADRVLFGSRHYLYYRKHGKKVELACTKCGGVVDVRWKAGESYESQFERMIEEPVKGRTGKCPLCNEPAEYRTTGQKRKEGKGYYLFLGQKYKNGIVMRYLEVEKKWELDMVGEKGREKMHGAYEELSGIEIARAYFEQGKKIQIDYQKHNPWEDKDFWDDCNLYGNANINIKAGGIIPETYANMDGTFLQYSAMEEYQKAAGDINPIEYLERYIQTPQIEMLVKIGLTEVVNELVRCRYGIVADINARRVDTFLGIRKERMKQLIRHRGSMDVLHVMQSEKNCGICLTEEQIEKLAALKITNLNQILEFMSIQKFLNRVEKYAGAEIHEKMCGMAFNVLNGTASLYIDYLSMRRNLGYDMQNTVYLFPRDLRAGHDKMVQEANTKEAEMKMQKANETYPMIRRNYRRLRRKFYYEDESFVIRPAKDAGEIVLEGRVLHHCVGGSGYLKNHNEGISIILLLRKKKERGNPYITVEIRTDTMKIVQFHGAYNSEPDRDRVQRWLNEYEHRLRYGTEAAGDRIMCTA